jgi:hypothetical protein
MSISSLQDLNFSVAPKLANRIGKTSKQLSVVLSICLLAGMNILMVGSTGVRPAYSQNNATINYFKQGYQRAYVGWANFNQSEVAMDRSIAAALEGIGKRSIPVTDQNLVWMMRQVNATPTLYTAGFVAGRMSILAEATQTLDRTDSLLCSIGTQFGISAGKVYC